MSKLSGSKPGSKPSKRKFLLFWWVQGKRMSDFCRWMTEWGRKICAIDEGKWTFSSTMPRKSKWATSHSRLNSSRQAYQAEVTWCVGQFRFCCLNEVYVYLNWEGDKKDGKDFFAISCNLVHLRNFIFPPLLPIMHNVSHTMFSTPSFPTLSPPSLKCLCISIIYCLPSLPLTQIAGVIQTSCMHPQSWMLHGQRLTGLELKVPRVTTTHESPTWRRLNMLKRWEISSLAFLSCLESSL
jgi:hypothetical protein